MLGLSQISIAGGTDMASEKQEWEKADELIQEVLEATKALNNERAAIHRYNGMNYAGVRAESLTLYLQELLQHFDESKTDTEAMEVEGDFQHFYERASLEEPEFEKVARLGVELARVCVKLQKALGVNLLEAAFNLIPPNPAHAATLPAALLSPNPLEDAPAIRDLKKNSEIMKKWSEIETAGIRLWYCVGRRCGIVWDMSVSNDEVCPRCGSEDIFKVEKLCCSECGRFPYEGDEPLPGDECGEDNEGMKCYGKFIPKASPPITWPEKKD